MRAAASLRSSCRCACQCAFNCVCQCAFNCVCQCASQGACLCARIVHVNVPASVPVIVSVNVTASVPVNVRINLPATMAENMPANVPASVFVKLSAPFALFIEKNSYGTLASLPRAGERLSSAQNKTLFSNVILSNLVTWLGCCAFR